VPGGISPFKSAKGEAQYFAAYDASMGLWPAPYESIEVTTRYGRTHINACGSKDAFPVILLHGGQASSTMWFPNVADLSSRFRVLALDTIGKPGKSVPSLNNATRQDCAAWLEGVIAELGIPKTHVVGLSRGGWLALNLALYAPRCLERIALLSPAASFISLSGFFRTVAAAAMRIRARPVLRAALHSWVAPGFQVNHTYAEQFILGLRYWNWAMNSSGYSGVMPSAFSGEELSQVHIPVLMLIGEHDRLNPLTTIEQARRMIPHIEAAIIPNAVISCLWSNPKPWMRRYSNSSRKVRELGQTLSNTYRPTPTCTRPPSRVCARLS
jgi:pimeloyl-ACP methyl ester carboxylesterase